MVKRLSGLFMDSGALIFLGTGNSEGVPVVFCKCHTCKGSQRRLRPSVLIKYKQRNFIIDIGPDFREQMLSMALDSLNGVFLTHPHYDHIGGLDDLRAYNLVFNESIPVYLSSYTYDHIKHNKTYLTHVDHDSESLPANLDFQILNEKYGKLAIDDEINVRYVTYRQKSMPVTGYCFGDIAYLTDIHNYDDDFIAQLKGINTLIVSLGLGTLPDIFGKRSHSHFSLDQALQLANDVGANRLLITHIGHKMRSLDKYTQLEIAYDGLSINWNNER